MRRWFLAAPAVFATLLGWGWWQAHTHATVNVTVNDVALKTPRQRWGQIKSGELVLRDAAGAALASARLTEPYGLVEFTDTQAGGCSRFERSAASSQAHRDAWQACFEKQSRWQATWASRVASGSLVAAGCRIDKVPVRLRRYGDWWLWWVPLPHVGGSPYTSFAFELRIDSARCAPSPDP